MSWPITSHEKHQTFVRYNPISNIGGKQYNLDKEFNKSTPGSFRNQNYGTKAIWNYKEQTWFGSSENMKENIQLRFLLVWYRGANFWTRHTRRIISIRTVKLSQEFVSAAGSQLLLEVENTPCLTLVYKQQRITETYHPQSQ